MTKTRATVTGKTATTATAPPPVGERMKIGAIHTVWKLATWTGLRRIGDMTKKVHAGAYGDSIWYFDDNTTTMDSINTTTSTPTQSPTPHPMDGVMALTIDDGLFSNRGTGENNSMVEEILELLKSYKAHATFMCCTKYTSPSQVKLVREAGHEFGNHLYDDPVPNYYAKMSKDVFRTHLHKSITYLVEDCGIPRQDLHWFRAPQGLMSKAMKDVVAEERLINVFGDCYCDDWAFAEYGTQNTAPVAPMMLHQFDRNTRVDNRGSIAIFHMPERNFRESTYKAIKEFLEGMQQRNIRCVTVTELSKLSKFQHPAYGSSTATGTRAE